MAAGTTSFDTVRVEHVAKYFAPHFFESHTFGVIESGECRFTTSRGKWIGEPGSAMILAPGEVHEVEVISDAPLAYRTMYVSPKLALALFPSGAPESGVPVTRPSLLTREFHSSLCDVASDAGDTAAQSAVLDCIAHLSRARWRLPPERATARETDLVREAREYLRARIGEHVSIASLADVCGVSIFRLIKAFRRVVGVSPYAYLVLLRVNRARAMLDAGASISHAGYACRFSDQSHFTRAFRRSFGLPPGHYVRARRSRGA